MEISELHSKVNDPPVAQLLDNILDAVLALKARLADSNMDSNSIGGMPFPVPLTQPRRRHYCVKSSNGGL